MKYFSVFVLLVMFSNLVDADGSLEGNYKIGGQMSMKGEVLQGNSHLYFTITGKSAKELYLSIETEMYESACTGYKVKGKNNFSCYEVEAGKIYACGFSINLDKNMIEAGNVGAC